jgi:large subunit ribosomal protein L9
MDVILLERVAKLGQMGEVVIRQGRLRPQLPSAAEEGAARQRGQHQGLRGPQGTARGRNLETKKEAEALAAKLDGQQFVIIRSASDAGALYGSVTTRDAADAATENGFTSTASRSPSAVRSRNWACTPCT